MSKDVQSDYLISESAGLRSEINIKVDELNRTFRFTVSAFGASMAWLLTAPEPVTLNPLLVCCASAIPFSLTLLFSIHANRVQKTIIYVAEYLSRVEKLVVFDDFGWENSEECRKMGRAAFVKETHDRMYAILLITGFAFFIFTINRYYKIEIIRWINLQLTDKI